MRTGDFPQPRSVLIGLGSNQGDRVYNLRLAVSQIRKCVAIVRVSSHFESEPIDCPKGAADFLNMVVVGHVSASASDLLEKLQQIEASMGRRRTVANSPRAIDLDLILYGSELRRDAWLVLPHPRYRTREFVLRPFRELGLRWHDPAGHGQIAQLQGQGVVVRFHRS
ncbi:MAG TPA: 2-amino-4-hydroxy-6-hydroxymethyldihydropteridine diphosphokinase [Thermoanaerobaculia bacterium]|nr:2-amino-4-hydroxy-6-hydroxymethyldihydropteridine diphosphokinase [Thermoanaerobaculia bacterium]